MDEPADLRTNPHWRRAVWALRAGFVGLAIAIIGVFGVKVVGRWTSVNNSL